MIHNVERTVLILSHAQSPGRLVTTLGARHLFIPMLQMEKPRLSEIEQVAQNHPTAEWLSWDSEFNSKARSPSKLSCCLRFQKPHLADGETNAQRGEMTGSRSYQDWGQSLKLTPDLSPDSTHPGTGSRLLWAESSFPTTNYSLSHSPWAKLNLLMGKKMPGKHLLVGRLSLCTSLLPLN